VEEKSAEVKTEHRDIKKKVEKPAEGESTSAKRLNEAQMGDCTDKPELENPDE
jgi:hypothetical protein